MGKTGSSLPISLLPGSLFLMLQKGSLTALLLTKHGVLPAVSNSLADIRYQQKKFRMVRVDLLVHGCMKQLYFILSTFFLALL